MSDNPYLQLLDEEEKRVAVTDSVAATPTEAPAQNPYLDTLNADEAALRTRQKATLRLAAAVNPEQAATARRLSKQRSLPPDVVMRNLEEIKRQEFVENGVRRASVSPALSSMMGDPSFVQAAQDDLDTLAAINAKYDTWKPAPGPAPTMTNIAAGVLKSLGQGWRASKAGIDLEAYDAFVAAGAEPDEVRRQELIRRFERTQSDIRMSTPEIESDTGRAVYGGLVSTMRQVPGLALSILTRSSVPMLAVAGGQVQTEAYGKYTARDGTPGEALLGSTLESAIEVATEKIPLRTMLGAFGKPGKQAALEILKSQLQEQVGEQVATLFQDAVDTAIANPDKTWGEYWAERPAAAYQTFVATLVQSGVVGGVHTGVQAVANKAEQEYTRSQQAEVRAKALEETAQLAAASKLSARDAGTFKDFLAQVAQEDGDTPTELYIDPQTLANTLNQSGMTMQEFAAVAPVAAGQLHDGEAEHDIRVPVSEFLAVKEEVTAPLIDHIRIGAEEPTRLEAREYLKTYGDQLKADMESQLTQVEDQAAFRESISQVRDVFTQQLTEAGRFAAPVNTAYADLLANYYGATAARLGMTPQALLQKYKLDVVAKGLGGERTLNQADPDPSGEVDEATGLPLNTDGTVTVYHHTSAENAAEIRRTSTLRSAGEPDLYFTTTAETNTGYGDTAVPFRVKPERLQLDDEFPDGRRDFRVEAPAKARRVRFRPDGEGVLNQSATPEQAALAALSQIDDIFSLPKSDKDTIEGITADNDPDIKVRKTELPGNETMWTLTMPDGRSAIITSRDPGKYGPSVYSNDFNPADNSYTPNTERPGENAESIGPEVGDVWIDVSRLKQGGSGSMVYNIASTFAHNTGRIFIGDPSGVSAVAMKRRPENMLSSALKFGTTKHLAPHPDQVRGKDGVPPLKWVYGDDIGNVRKLIDLTLEIQKDAGNEGLLSFDPATGRFTDRQGRVVDDGPVSSSEQGRPDQPGDTGNRTAKRGAVFSALLREEGAKGDSTDGDGPGLLERLVRFASESPAPIFYQGDVTPRAQIALPSDLTASHAVISLLAGADLSSFIHESGHFFLEVQADLATRIQQQIDAGASVSDGERGIVDDMNRLLGWFGVKGNEHQTALQEWAGMTLDEKREHHEQFARGFEAYTMEGKSPSLDLQKVFSRFRSWLVQVYKTLRGLNVELNDDVRGVMARMLATDYAIQEAEAARNMGPLFKDAASAGMTLEEFNDYQATAQGATARAAEELQARGMKDMKWLSRARDKALKARQQEVDELRREIRNEVSSEVMREPVYRAWQYLTAKSDDAAVSGKLRTEELREMYGAAEDAVWRKLSALRMTSDTTGRSPETVAEDMGFASGDALVQALADAMPPQEVIDARTDQRMLEMFGDINSAEALQKAADEAVHNEVRARFIATELKALAAANKVREADERNGLYGDRRTVDVLARAAKDYAQQIVARLKVRDIRPAQYTGAEARSAKLAEKAMLAGKLDEAAMHKRNQLVNNYAAKAAFDAQAEIRKALEFFKKVNAGNAEKIAQTRDPAIVNAARAVLAEYGLGTKGKTAQEYLSAVEANDPASFAVLRDRIDALTSQAVPFKELSVERLQGLTEEIRSLWQMAKRSRQIEIDGQLIDKNMATIAINERLVEIGIPDRVPGEGRAVTEGERRLGKLRSFGAALRRVESWVGAKDGSGQARPFRRFVWQPVRDAADSYRLDKAKYLKAYRNLLQGMDLGRSRIDAPELGYTFGFSRGGSGKQEILHALLHTGNESNKRKLLLGRGWASESPDGALDTSRWDAFVNRMIAEGKLGKADFDFAQGVWDLLDSMKPLAQKAHRDVFGRYFNEVTADAFVTPYGTYRGGYVPALTDSEVVSDAKTREFMEQENQTLAYAFPSTAKGFTKGRVEYNKPLLLDLRSLSQHIDKVLLFSHLEQPVRDVRKVLTAKEVAEPLNRIDPAAFDGILTPWMNRVARQQVETPVPGSNGLMRFFSKARSRAGIAAMFANMANTAQQITGLSIAAVKVKPKYLMPAVAQMIHSPRQTAQAVAEASKYMATRMDNEVAQMTDAINDILLNPNVYEKAQAWTAKHAYFMQSAVDNIIGPVVWQGAYNQALEAGETDADAIRLADAAVRETQGSSLPEDIARFEGGNAFVRMFTQFAGYFNMQANLLGTEFSKGMHELGLRKGMGRGVYVFTLGFLAPALVSELIVQAFRGGPEDDDRDGEYLDDWLAALGMGTLRSGLAMIPVVGQGVNAIINMSNTKPYDDRISTSPAISMIESAARAPNSVYEAVVNDGSARKAVRDVATLITLTTGLPANAVARPVGYLADVAQERIEPTSAVDAARGMVSGTASPESKR